jgi:hypothetical protein
MSPARLNDKQLRQLYATARDLMRRNLVTPSPASGRRFTGAVDDLVLAAGGQFESEPRATRLASVIFARRARASWPRLSPDAQDYGHDERLCERVVGVIS